MIKKILGVLISAFLIPLAFSTMAKADSIYMQVTDIKGESKVRAYDGWIELNGFAFSANRPATAATGGARAAAKVIFGDIKIQKYMDLSSTALMSSVATGKSIKTIVIDVVRDTGEDDYVVTKYTLSDVYVSSFTQSHSAGDEADTGVEEIGLNYGKITVDYSAVLANGKAGAKTKFGWDITANRAI